MIYFEYSFSSKLNYENRCKKCEKRPVDLYKHRIKSYENCDYETLTAMDDIKKFEKIIDLMENNCNSQNICSHKNVLCAQF